MQDLHENHVLVIVASGKNITIKKKQLPRRAHYDLSRAAAKQSCFLHEYIEIKSNFYYYFNSG